MNPKSHQKLFNMGFLLFGLFFFSMGLFFGILNNFIEPPVKITSGKIIDIEKRVENNKNVVYYPKILYVVKNKERNQISYQPITKYQYNIGDVITVYIDRDDPSSIYTIYADWLRNKNMEKYIIPIPLLLLGIIFILATFFQINGEKKKHFILSNYLKKNILKKYNKVTGKLFETNEKGFYLFGGVLTLIGSVLVIVLYNQVNIVLNNEITEKSFVIIPFLFGLGLLYTGLTQFYNIKIMIKDNKVYYQKSFIIGNKSWEESLNNFVGIARISMSKQINNRLPVYYIVYVLIHPDFNKSYIKIGEILESKNNVEYEKELSETFEFTIIDYESNQLKSSK